MSYEGSTSHWSIPPEDREDPTEKGVRVGLERDHCTICGEYDGRPPREAFVPDHDGMQCGECGWRASRESFRRVYG